jgi:hypothetical protein
VVKQDNNGDTFIITDAAMPHLDEHTTTVEVTPRSIGAWFPNRSDLHRRARVRNSVTRA